MRIFGFELGEIDVRSIMLIIFLGMLIMLQGGLVTWGVRLILHHNLINGIILCATNGLTGILSAFSLYTHGSNYNGGTSISIYKKADAFDDIMKRDDLIPLLLHTNKFLDEWIAERCRGVVAPEVKEKWWWKFSRGWKYYPAK